MKEYRIVDRWPFAAQKSLETFTELDSELGSIQEDRILFYKIFHIIFSDFKSRELEKGVLECLLIDDTESIKQLNNIYGPIILTTRKVITHTFHELEELFTPELMRGWVSFLIELLSAGASIESLYELFNSLLMDLDKQ